MKRIDTTQALKLLMQDHRRVRRLLRHAEEVDGDPLARARAVDLACRELEAHAQVEEQFLYPLLSGLSVDDATQRAAHDHEIARQLIEALDRLGPADGDYRSTLADLAEWIDEHVREEEATLLTRAKAADLDLALLGEALLDRQRHGALTDVDVDAELAEDSAVLPPCDDTRASPDHDRQRERAPRRGAH